MSSRPLFIGLIVLIAVVLIAMLVVMIGIYRQNEALAPTSVPTLTATINEATLDATVIMKVTGIAGCLTHYPGDLTKSAQCADSGGYFEGTSTPIP